ncbi:MAG: methyl-accepting chemotaxis protein [Polyangiaceae bacterium]|jgi:methyl-accepting chemotaxis protein
MNGFGNLRISAKIGLGFAAITSVTCVVGWLCLSCIGQVASALENAAHRQLPATVEILRVDKLALAMTRDVRQALLVPSEREELRERVTKYDEAIRALLDGLAPKQATEVGRTLLRAVRSAYDPIWASSLSIMDCAARGDAESGIAELERAKSETARLTSAIQAMEDRKNERVERMLMDAEDTNVKARWTVGAGIILAALVGVALSFLIGRGISAPLKRAGDVLELVAEGDFTRSLDIDSNDEVGVLSHRLNRTLTSMRRVLREVHEFSNTLAVASEQLSSASQDISAGAQEQAASLEETAASIEEISSTAKQNADRAQHAAELACETRDAAEKGGRVVRSATSAMDQITESSRRIADIITAIDEIAFQTNLLALNAAVEAARAGEQGRGFAVVAAEVRTLAQRSATAAKEIKGLIHDSHRKVDEGAAHVHASGETLAEIVESVKRVTDLVSEIAVASREQNVGVDQVSKAVSRMDHVTQSNAAQTEELSATAHSLASDAEHLQALSDRFKLGVNASEEEF